jgi:L-amino acid N-acyltransferase YncA
VGEEDNLKVRRATLVDLPAITEIYNHEVAEATSTFDTEPRNDRSAREWYEAHQSATYPLIVAEDDRKVVAWATLSPWSPRGGYLHTAEASLFVREGHRGKGVGTVLTRELISLAVSAGHHVLLARVEAGNRQSRSVLMSQGFRSVGVLHQVGRKFGRWLDNETFELVIKSGEVPGDEAEGPDG